MTIPNVTITWCGNGKARCKWCEQPIATGTAMVRVYYWNKGNEERRSWNIQNCYHFPDCYVAQGKDYLDRNPYVVKVRARRNLLSPEDKRKRFLLIRRFNELVQRRNKIAVGYPDNLAVEIQLTERMVEVMMEVAVLGGVPKSWAGKIV